MLQKYARNDEHQPVPEKKILKTWRIKSMDHLRYYTTKLMI
jgi:hypothetical protein